MAVKNIPAGAMVKVRLANIDEGNFVQQVEEELDEAVRKLLEYEKRNSDTTGKARVTIHIDIKRMKGASTFMNIETHTVTKTPTAKKLSQAKVARDGKLICQPVGTNEDPDQMNLYDANGSIISPSPDVAGKIGAIAK